MKIFVLTFLVLAISCALNEAGCIRDDRGECKSRIFSEPEPREIHYVYHGESCSCPKRHDVIIQELKDDQKERREKLDISYGIQAPQQKEEKLTRYLFDVRIEQPVENKPESSKSGPFNYQLQTAPQKIQPVRYMYDTRIEQPVAPCKDKPWQGLVAQIDTISMPRTCSNSDHTPETCNCGCRDPTHTRKTCNCGADKNLYTIPIIYGEDSPPLNRPKRDTESSKSAKKSNRRELKIPKLKKIDPKELASIIRAEHLKLKLKDPKDLKKKSSSIFTSKLENSPRPKRKESSPCSYTFESCDPSRKTAGGCPLCYKCKCEPAGESDLQRFSSTDIKIPYRMANRGEQFAAPTQQEFDTEPSAYTGLDQDMYRRYIQEIISKYPEHMSRRMPDLMDQQRDLQRFISEMSRNDRSPQNVQGEDIRYKMIDNAMDLYKYYERAMSKVPKMTIGKDGKLLKKKRGTVLEVIEMTSDEIKDAGLKIGAEDFGDNFSD